MRMKNFLIGASLLLAGSDMLCARASYIAPKPTQLMFQVDKLPMDKGTRKWLSGNLTTLAKRQHDGSAKEQRLTAQLLMLAMRVDSNNQDAIETNQNLVDGKTPVTVDLEESMKSITKIQLALKNLENTDEGSEAHVLAEYLKDVIHAYEPGNDLVANHQFKHSRWEGILPKPAPAKPKLSDAKTVAKIETVANKSPKPDNNLAAGKEAKKEEKKVILPTRWNAQSSSITQPLLIEYKDNKDQTHFQSRTELVRLNVSVSPKEALDSSIELQIEPTIDPGKVSGFKKHIETMMKNRFGKFQSIEMKLSTASKLHQNSRSEILLSICLQLLASEKGISIKEDAMVLGRLEGGKIKRNWDFWKKLKYFLPDGSASGRFIIPAEAEPDLTQLLALEKESFFIKNEVLIAETIEEAVQLLGQSSNTDINDAAKQFANIQRLIGTKSVGPYSVDKQMRKRLEDILSKNPNHLSAKMILLRGDNTRNKRLERFYLAKEISYILNRIGWLVNQKIEHISPSFLEESVKEIEEFQKEYADLTDTKDRDLMAYLSNITETFEVVIRNKKKRDSKATNNAIKEAMEQFAKQYKDAKTVVDEILKTLPPVVK